MSLQSTINEYKAGFIAKVPEEIRNTMLAATENLSATGIEANALNTGDSLPDTTLADHQGNQVNLKSLLSNGPLVISFYRGGWCPYCNLELQALQQHLGDIKATGAKLIAITPELPDQSLNTAEKNQLAFPVLSDVGSVYAKQLGLMFELAEELRPIYAKFGIDLQKHNGEATYDLPLAATYVVGQDGTIVFGFVDADYTKRLEPSDVIEVLKRL